MISYSFHMSQPYVGNCQRLLTSPIPRCQPPTQQSFAKHTILELSKVEEMIRSCRTSYLGPSDPWYELQPILVAIPLLADETRPQVLCTVFCAPSPRWPFETRQTFRRLLFWKLKVRFPLSRFLSTSLSTLFVAQLLQC